MSELRFERLIERARRTNRIRDKADRKNGHAAPDDGPLNVLLDAVLSTIEYGIRAQDWDRVAEGFVMLEDFVGAMRTP